MKLARAETPDLKPERPGLRSERPKMPDLRLERPDLRPERPDLRPERSDWGGTNKRMDEQTDEQKSPCVLQDFVPFGAAAQKVDFRPDRAGFRFESADFRSRRAGFMSERANSRLHWVDLWSR